MIEENLGEEDEEFSEDYKKMAAFSVKGCVRILRHCDSASALIDKRLALRQRLAETSGLRIPPRIEDKEEDEKEEHEMRLRDYQEEQDDEENIDDKRRMLEELASDNEPKDDDLSWFRRSDIPIDIPLDSDEGSLSSGCESASTFNSTEEHTPTEETSKPEPEFKLGGTVLSSLDRLTNCTDVRKYCGLKHHLRMSQEIPDAEEVSLIPVGETHSDFSSLKVFKKRSVCEAEKDSCIYDCTDGGENNEREETGSACSDESGYDELIDCTNNDDSPSPISKIVLV